jgi:predicted DNA binding CopG/RHH family protein
MEKAVKKGRIPRTDSIQELAEFWDTHDSTDFEDELVEVTEPVFERPARIEVRLPPEEAAAVRQLARSKGITQQQLIREWVAEMLAPTKRPPTKKRANAGSRTRAGKK